MTFRLSSWLFSRNPRILLIVLALLWIAQMSFWVIWEWQRVPVLVTTLAQDSGSTQSVLSVEIPIPDVLPPTIPESPFLSQNPDVLNRFFDYPDEHFAGLNVPLTNQESTSTVSNSPAPSDLSPLILVETNVVDFAKTLRYRGFLQTAKGDRIAFVEDAEAASTHRLHVGERFKDWILQSIKRENLVFTSDEGENVTILRQGSNLPVATEKAAVAIEKAAVATEEVAVATEKAAGATEKVAVATEEAAVATEEVAPAAVLVTTSVEAEPQSETDPDLAQEVP